MCSCYQELGGEPDETLTVACDECLDRESADRAIEGYIAERESVLIEQAELLAEWTGACELLEVK